MSDSLPDFRSGILVRDLADGAIVTGRVGDDEIIVVRRGDEFHAVGAHCTHYHGPLAEGLIVGDTIRCPWHHACFSLKTGEALRAPAIEPIEAWAIERRGDTLFIRGKQSPKPAEAPVGAPESIVIVGGGAAGFAAAEMLRRRGYRDPITMLSDDSAPPSDRPNLSKDYLAGTAKEDWIPLKPPEFYAEHHIDFLPQLRVTSIDPSTRSVRVEDGRTFGFGSLLIATGAEPVQIPLSGQSAIPVLYLRSLADSQAIIEQLGAGKHAVVIGASFIGLEVAASLRERGIAVDVVAPDEQPLAKIMGPDVGRFIRSLHEAKGVQFHLGSKVERLDGRILTLSDGSTIAADLVVVGAGVRPRTLLAEEAGLAVDHGVRVDEYLETSSKGIFAAGDIARWPDPHSGERIRVEHWVVAERQGQVAAINMLGGRQPFDAVPFFWSQHYDVTIRYSGHAPQWDRVSIDGSLDARDCAITYWRQDRRLAVATIGRDRACLKAETDFESSPDFAASR